MTDRPDNTRVNIYGREYSIRGEGDPAYILEIAHFLDMRMRQMTENVTMTSTAKVAILASLNIIDELFSKTEQLEEMEDSHQMFINKLAGKIEKLLEQTESPSRHDKTGVSGDSPDISTPVTGIFQKQIQEGGDSLG